jgi:uncharacterized protein (DUF1330 family)
VHIATQGPLGWSALAAFSSMRTRVAQSRLEFDSVEKARAWWGSTQYAAAKKIRQRPAISSVIIVEGM